MARKINGKWFRRAWIEGTKSEAQREADKMNRGSPYNSHVVVAEIKVSRDGSREKIFSIYYRPKRFTNEKDRKRWNETSVLMAKDDRQDRTHGIARSYIILAR